VAPFPPASPPRSLLLLLLPSLWGVKKEVSSYVRAPNSTSICQRQKPFTILTYLVLVVVAAAAVAAPVGPALLLLLLGNTRGVEEQGVATSGMSS
jgi:hypothetical protein